MWEWRPLLAKTKTFEITEPSHRCPSWRRQPKNYGSAGAEPSSKVRKISFWRATILVSRKNFFVLDGEPLGEPKIFCRHPDLPTCRNYGSAGAEPSSEQKIFPFWMANLW